MNAASTCPHGNHYAGTNPHDELIQVCAVCGGPRITGGVATKGSENEPLRDASRALGRRRAWRAAAGFGAFAGLGSAGLGALIALIFGGLGAVSGTFLVLSLPFVLLFFVGLAKAKGFSSEVAQQLAAAWKKAARDVVVAAQRPLTPRDLAQAMSTKESNAERWLAELSADGVVRSDVTEQGEIAYARYEAPMRIDTSGQSANTSAAADPASELSAEEAELEARFAELAKREQQKQ
jgi:hypothetical protein